LLGFGLSNIGDGLRLAALPLLAKRITDSPPDIALLTAISWAPWLFVGLHAGGIVDRVDRIQLIVRLQVVHMVAALALAALVVSDLPNSSQLLLLYLIALTLGVTEVFVDTSFQALIPEYVPVEHLESANGRIAVTETLSNRLAGPAVGALIFSFAAESPFLVDAVTFVASAALVKPLSTKSARPKPVAETEANSLWHEVLEGLRYLRNHRLLSD